ncbi:DUF4148 domain-containing protein [Herbaspirillum sp. ST 5-3]|uniref:DUF4148 domain-containing protein n=1 Tax=Oxalobacteraceae TaxID=75682 RepID=UPI0010A42F86|nr:DUF4148 domain-containing protein [Herbaspirillum sp. ST 5-3]
MKQGTPILALVISALISYPVLAQDTAKPKTRAEVKAETAKAAKAGELNKNTECTDSPRCDAGKTRAEVKAETAKAAKTGELNKNIECPDVPRTKGTRTRAEVKAETAQAAKAGELNKNLECADIPPKTKGAK